MNRPLTASLLAGTLAEMATAATPTPAHAWRGAGVGASVAWRWASSLVPRYPVRPTPMATATQRIPMATITLPTASPATATDILRTLRLWRLTRPSGFLVHIRFQHTSINALTIAMLPQTLSECERLHLRLEGQRL